MPYFITRKVFLFPSFDLEEKEREKISKFLMLLEKSGVGDVVVSKYVKNNTEKGGRPNSNYYNLFATILYGFAFKKSTLRDIEDACKYDLRYIYLMEQTQLDYSTICKFINKVISPNEEEIFSLINQEIQNETGIIFEDAFIDGTKYEANANKYKFVWKPIKHHKNLTLKASEIINQYHLLEDFREDMIRSSTIVTALINLKYHQFEMDEKTYKSVNKALTSMALKVNEYEEKEEICGPNRKSYYKTDKDATAMALKADYYSGLGSNMHAAYNVQHLVIRGYVFSYYVSQSRTDLYDFIPVLDKFFRLYGYFPARVCADAGYGSLENYRYLKRNHIESYVKHQSWEGNKSGRNPDCYHLNDDDTITCLNGNFGYQVNIINRHPKKAEAIFYKVTGCNSCGWMPFCKKYMRRIDEDFKIFEVVKDLERLKYESHQNLLSPKGIEIRVNRSIQVEGSFGIAKQDYGYTRTRRRGIENVSTEIMLNALGMNIAKLFRFYTTNKLDKYWTAPSELEKENIKSPSMKRLVKKGRRINLEIYKNDK